jgi:hypothetical protein
MLFGIRNSVEMVYYGDKTSFSNYHEITLLSTSYNIEFNILLSSLNANIDEINKDHQCGFDVTDQQLLRFSAFIWYWRKKWEYNETVYQLFIDFKNPII